jgi:hypothetical protein
MKRSLIPFGGLICVVAIVALGQVEIEPAFGIVWEDLRFPATAETLPAGAANIVVDPVEVGLSFQTDADIATDWTTMNAQMQHSYRLGSNLYPHIHWVQTEDEIPNFLLEYRCFDIGEDPTGSFIQAARTTNAITYSSGTIHQMTMFPNFNPNFSGVSGMCDLKLYRDTDNSSTEFAGADQFSTDVLVKEFDFHYQRDAPGSKQESVKW